jgi:thiol-disulfide isomerase/thioredoxin
MTENTLKNNQYSRSDIYFLWELEQVKSSLLVLVMLLFLTLLFTSPSSANEKEEIRLGRDQVEHILSLETISETSNLKPEELKNKVTVVAFFASWCPPCRDEFKALNEIKQKLKDQAPTIIAINVFEDFDDKDEERMTQFLKDTKPHFHLVKGTDESLKLFGDVFRIPTMYVFDQIGKLAFDFIHKPNAKKRSVETNELMEAIKPLIIENNAKISSVSER